MLPAILAALGEASAAGSATAAGLEGIGAGSSFTGHLGALSAAGSQFSDAGQKVTSGLGGIKKALTDLVNPISHFENAVGKLYHTVNFLPSKILEIEGMITSTAHNWVATLAAPITTIKQLGDAVSGFVRLSSPGTVLQFEYRVENTFATLGRILQPILEALTRAAEKTGDAFSKLAPAFSPIMSATAELTDAISDTLVPAFRELAPLIYITGVHIRGFVELLRLAVKYGPLGLGLPLTPFRGLFGFDEKAKSDVAVRMPQYRTTEELQREMAKNALLASAGGEPKEDKVPNLLQDILNFLNNNLTLDKLKEALAGLIGQFIPNLPKFPNIPGFKVGAVEGGIVGGFLQAVRQES